MINTFWETEEFEINVEAALVAGLEPQDDHRKRAPKGYFVPSHKRVTPSDYDLLKKVGMYFCPDDRQAPPENEFWYDIDGFPDLATWVNDSKFAEAVYEATKGRNGGGYLGIAFARRIKKLPRDFFALSPLVAKYKLILLFPQTQGGCHATAYYFGVSDNSKVLGCQCRRDATNNTEVVAMFGASVLNNFSDRKHLWNVTAIDNDNKVTFGVYPEQIKSLLYARDLPISTTGRKRPILHWVSAHRRRIKEGIDVDINKHLRGVSEFEMNDLCFQITRPLKNGIDC